MSRRGTRSNAVLPRSVSPPTPRFAGSSETRSERDQLACSMNPGRVTLAKALMRRICWKFTSYSSW